MSKQPLSISTDEIYIQAKTDVLKNFKFKIDEENNKLNIELSLPISDISKILASPDIDVENPKYFTVYNVMNYYIKQLKNENKKVNNDVIELTQEDYDKIYKAMFG